MVQNLKKVLKSKISKKISFLRHEVPFKAKNNREAVVVCAIHVVKRPSYVLILYQPYYLNFKSIMYQPEADPDPNQRGGRDYIRGGMPYLRGGWCPPWPLLGSATGINI